MWGSFKAAFAATMGVLLAWKLVDSFSDPNFLEEIGEKANDYVGDWKKSRKISHPDEHPYTED